MNTMKATAIIFMLLALALVALCFSNPTHPAAIVALTFAFVSAMLGAMFAGLGDNA